MENQEEKETHPFVTIHCEFVEDADAGIDSDATVKFATSTHQSSPLAPTTQRGDFGTKFNMKERWRVHDNFVAKSTDFNNNNSQKFLLILCVSPYILHLSCFLLFSNIVIDIIILMN